ncbi:MAG: zinc-dependent metalloprotease [Pseudobdellovibrionaceae bacterium]
MKTANTTSLLKALSLAAAIATLAACTEKREAKLPDAEKEVTFSISTFKNKEYQITTSDKVQQTDARKAVTSSGQVQTVSLAKSTVPDSIKFMVDGLKITGKTSTNYTLRFKIDKNYITAYKVVTDVKSLTSQEQQLVEKAKADAELAIFQYKVEGYGRLTRIKNDLGENTSNMRMEPTEWAAAEVVKITPKKDARLEVRIGEGSEEEANRIFVRSKVTGQVLTRDQLSKLYDINLNLPGSTFLYTELNGNDLRFYEVADRSKLSEAQRLILKNKINNGEVRECPKEVKSVNKSEDCVLLANSSVTVEHVKAERKKDVDGLRGREITFKATTPSEQTDFIKIVKDPVPKPVNISNILDPRSTLYVDQLKNQEFLYRRTLVDSTSNFEAVYPGLTGPIALVKFEFEESRVVVRRTGALVKSTFINSLDKEELLSFPAKYKKLETQDAQGRKLTTGKWIDAKNTDAGAIAVIDWSQNSIPTVNSPLAYYDAGECLTTKAASQIFDVDMKLDSGILNFSMKQVYALNQYSGCASISWSPEGIQTVYGFIERFSFMKNTAELDKPLVPQIPDTAQKALGYGMITFPIQNKDAFNNKITEDTMTHITAHRDFRNGKAVHYVLTGIPKTGKARETIIKATREVVEDWNRTLRFTFRGTQYDRTTDFVTLSIDGEPGAPQGTIGDLNTNYIYYVQKHYETGILGVVIAGYVHPRSGLMQGSNVMVFGGALEGQAGYEMWVRSIEKKYAADKEKAKNEGVEELNLMAAAMAKAAGTPQGSPPATPSGSLTTGKLTAFKKSMFLAKTIENLSKNKNSAKTIAQLEKVKTSLTNSRKTTKEIDLAELEKNFFKNPEIAYYAVVMKRAEKEKAFGNPVALRSIIAQEHYKAFSPKMSPAQKREAYQETIRFGNQAKMQKRLAADHNCATFSFNSQEGIFPMDHENAEAQAVFINNYKGTLAHEMGHAFGLDHNFEGSVDKANFLFEGEDSKRGYSSIMEYIDDSKVKYDAMGPYDAYAMRAGYTGLVELDIKNEKIKNLVKTESGKSFLELRRGNGTVTRVNAPQGKFIATTDLKNLMQVGSWSELSKRRVKNFKLTRNYMYCTNGDEGFLSPMCNMHDRGTNPAEIVEALTQDYFDNYQLANFPNDRATFYNSYRYQGRLLRSFSIIRRFMTDFFYQVISGVQEDTIEKSFEASQRGLLFFHTIIRTPEVSDLASPGSTKGRFLVKRVGVEDEKGNKSQQDVLVERKWTNSMTFGPETNRLAVLGILADKIFSTIFLTDQSTDGIMEAQQLNISVSYLDFERLLVPSKSPLNMPTVGLLNELLNDHIAPVGATELGPIALADDPTLEIEIPIALRYYGAHAAAISLDQSVLLGMDNFSRLFSVGSSIGNVPDKDAPFLVAKGLKNDSPTALKLWAYENAEITKATIQKGMALKMLTDPESEVNKALQQFVSVYLTIQEVAASQDKAKIDELKAQLPAITEKIAASLAQVPKDLGEADLDGLDEYLTSFMTQLQGLNPAKMSISMEQLPDIQMAHKNISRASPLMTATLLALKQTIQGQIAEALKERSKENLAKLSPEDQEAKIKEAIEEHPLMKAFETLTRKVDKPEEQYDMLYSNMELLNDLFFLVNDKYRR